MCVPVCMFVRTSTVLLPSRWCVVMSVTWIASNWGQVGIRSPQACVRSTSFIGRKPNSSVREVLLAELRDDLGRDRQVDHVRESQVLLDLSEVLLALDRALDIRFRHALVLRPGFGLHEGVERVRDDVLRLLGELHPDVDDL